MCFFLQSLEALILTEKTIKHLVAFELLIYRQLRISWVKSVVADVKYLTEETKIMRENIKIAT